MKPLSCSEVKSLVYMYAAGECESEEADAIRQHLADCPRCAAACDEARQFLGLLDLRLQEPERLRRLEDRIAAEAKPRRRVLRFPATLRPVAALAALLLLTVGLIIWLKKDSLPAERDGVQVAERDGVQMAERDGAQIAEGGLVAMLRDEPFRGELEAVPGAASELRGAKKEAPREHRVGTDQRPPAVDLTLWLRNTTDELMRVWVTTPPSESDLRLELRGPGVAGLPLLRTGNIRTETKIISLPPGSSHAIQIASLVDSHRAWFWTKPGDYTVTAEFTTRVWTERLGERPVVIRSEPLTLHVVD
jgi:hypothetical protein